MKAFDLSKDKYIGKTKDITEEGISATEKFQRVFLSVYEDIQKIPHNIKELFLSNIIYRVFSHNVYQTIDERTSSFFKEKVEPKQNVYTVTTDYTWIYLDPTIVKRSKKIGLTITNNYLSQACEVHVRPPCTSYGTSNYNDVFYDTVPANTESYFQFDYSFNLCKIGLKFNSGSGNVMVKVTYTPL